MTVTKDDLFSARMQIQGRLRKALEDRGYREVLTPMLQQAAGADPEIEPMTTQYSPLMEPLPKAMTLSLHTSPEFAMKRLICRGHQAIYQICQAFRQGELSPRHSPEFTICEWYRTGWTYRKLMDEMEELLVEVAGETLAVNENKLSLSPPLPRIPVEDALAKAGADPGQWNHLPDHEWLEKFHHALVEKVEPWLAKQGAVFLVDYPEQAAVLSRLKPDDPLKAERFELIVAGVEIANGCTELTDYQEHVRRFEKDRKIRRAKNKPEPKVPVLFLKDLEELRLPPCAGVAMGVDRLAMLVAGAERIERVQAFPFAR